MLRFQNFSDHYPIRLNSNVESGANAITQTCRNLSFLKDPNCIRNYLFCLSNKLSLITTHILTCQSVRKSIKPFNDFFLDITSEFAPIKLFIASKTKNPKWLCNDYKKTLRTLKNDAHRKWKQSRKLCLLDKIKKLRNKLDLHIKKSKKQYFEKTFSKCLGHSRQTYKLINDLTGKSIRSQNVPFNSNGKVERSKKDITNCFNKFIIGIGKNVADKIRNHPLKTVNSQIQFETDKSEVIEIINTLDNKSSSVEHEICNMLVKTTSQIVAPLLTYLFNLSFKKGKLTGELKKHKF